MSLFLIDPPVRHDSVVSRFQFLCLGEVQGRNLKALHKLHEGHSRWWSLLKLWILSEVLSVNGRGLDQCSSRHFLGYHWSLAEIHGVGSWWGLLVQIHIQSRAQNSPQPWLECQLHVSTVWQEPGQQHSLVMYRPGEQMALTQAWQLRMPDKAWDTCTGSMGSIPHPACVGGFSAISQNLFILGGLHHAIY